MPTLRSRAAERRAGGREGVARRRSGAAVAALLAGTSVLALCSALGLVRVEGTSMAPTLCDGDTLLVLDDRWAGSPRVDDLVVLEDPGRPGTTLVKRVVATGGQQVSLADGALVRDGRTVDEPWAEPATLPGVYSAPVLVADGFVYVLGDNREVSVDSRLFGPVPRSALDDRVLARVPTRCSR